MEVVHRMAAILIFSIALYSVCDSCEVDDVAVYKVKLQLWDGALNGDRDKSQWSQVFGQSHNTSHTLYRVGEITRPLVKNFLQFGSLEDLMEEGEEESKVYDQFEAPPLNANGKDTEGIVFVDGGHTLVSVLSRLITSANWFIGVDSLELCVHSSWIDQVTLDLELLSAEFGFNEQENRPVEKISHQNADFAGSSYGRHARQSRSVAKAEFTKVKEYSTKELNDLARKELTNKMKMKADINMPRRINTKYSFKDEFSTKNPFEQLQDLEEDPVGTPRLNNPEDNVLVVTRAPVFQDSSSELGSDLKNMDEVVLAVAHGRKLGLRKHLPRHFKSRLHHAVNKHRGADCIVSEWSTWSDCSDPCEEQTRIRTVVQMKTRHGKDCPPLKEKRHCGHCVRGDGDYVW